MTITRLELIAILMLCCFIVIALGVGEIAGWWSL